MRSVEDSYCTMCGRDVPTDYILWTPDGVQWDADRHAGAPHVCPTCFTDEVTYHVVEVTE